MKTPPPVTSGLDFYNFLRVRLPGQCWDRCSSARILLLISSCVQGSMSTWNHFWSCWLCTESTSRCPYKSTELFMDGHLTAWQASSSSTILTTWLTSSSSMILTTWLTSSSSTVLTAWQTSSSPTIRTAWQISSSSTVLTAWQTSSSSTMLTASQTPSSTILLMLCVLVSIVWKALWA